MGTRLQLYLTSLTLVGVGLTLGPGYGLAEAAQARTGSIRVEVRAASAPVEGATVTAGGVSAATDASGIVVLGLSPGAVSVSAVKDGYDLTTARVDVVADSERSVQLVLELKRRGRDQAIELGRDEIEKQILATPGSIAGSLDRIPGLRTQTTSPELGLTTVRIQGLRGPYTRLLADGVPQYFDLPGGLAPVQIPMMDINRVDVITGSTSAIFGANAVGGTIDLVSRRPTTEREREFLFSQSIQAGTDAVLWMTSPSTGNWSRTLLASAHYQDERDGDDDGWSDIPGYSRIVARPRVLWKNDKGKSASGTGGVTFEKRDGGGEIARQSFETRTADGALFGQMPLGRYVLAGAASLYVQSRTRDFNDLREHERRQAATMELELRGTAKRHRWIAGVVTDWFTIRTVGEPSYLSTRPGIFAHDDMELAPWLVLSGSARADYHNVHGFFLSPRGSVLARSGPWAARVSGGRSFYEPTAVTEETEAAGYTRLTVEGPLERETANSVSADFSFTTPSAAMTFTMFRSRINDPALVDRTTYTLRTESEPVKANGMIIQGTMRRAPYSATASYTYVEARERGDLEVALTPRHSAALIAEAATTGGRVRFEVRFTGTQRLDANPYRSMSADYTLLNLQFEHRFGRWRVFANADNLTDVRQTNWDPIARPAADVDGRWTVDAWAPLSGRVINFGIRASF